MRAILLLILVASTTTAQSTIVERVRPLQLPKSDAKQHSLAWLPDGKQLVTVDNLKVIRIWDVTTGKETAQLTPTGKVAPHAATGLAISRDGKRIAMSIPEQGVQIWDRVTNKTQTLSRSLLFGEDNLRDSRREDVAELAFSKDSQNLLILSNEQAISEFSLEGKVVRARTKMPVEFGKGQKVLIRDEAAVSLRAGLGFAYYEGDEVDELRTWDFAQQKVIARVPLKDGTRPVSYAIDPTGRWGIIRDRLAKATPGAEPKIQRVPIQLIDTRSLLDAVQPAFADPAKLLANVYDEKFAVQFSPNGRLYNIVASGTYTELYDAPTGTPLLTTKENADLSSAVSLDTRSIAIASGSTVRIVDLQKTLDPKPPAFDAEMCWKELISSDGKVAIRAVYRLADNPKDAIKLIAERVKPATKPSADELTAWLKDLDDPAFATRQAAAKKLGTHADSLEAELQKAIAENASPEVVNAATSTLETLHRSRRKFEGTTMRSYRIVQVLEMIGTEGKELLQQYAAGAKGAFLTQEATWALSRLP